MKILKKDQNGHGTQRYRFKKCGKYFQTEFFYNASKYEVSDQIIAKALNGSGIRDTGRVLKFSNGKVIKTIKKTRRS